MIAIIDYGRGNLRSVHKALEKSGFMVEITSDPAVLDDALGIILPGVGAFGDAMEQLRSRGLIEPIRKNINSGKPFLGICLGMQVLFELGEEHGEHKGLGVLPGKVVKFPAGLKVPHMGWNQLQIKRKSALLTGIASGESCYFVHSFYVATPDPEIVLASSDYSLEFPAAVGKHNLFGVQFHPEKSSATGLKILENFGGMVQL